MIVETHCNASLHCAQNLQILLRTILKSDCYPELVLGTLTILPAVH
jgi:hypothetical protein